MPLFYPINIIDYYCNYYYLLWHKFVKTGLQIWTKQVQLRFSNSGLFLKLILVFASSILAICKISGFFIFILFE